MAQVTGGTVAVIGQRFNDNGNAVGAVALIYHLFVAVLILAARSLLNAALNILVGHIGSLGLGDAVAQLTVGIGIGAALFYRYRHLTGHLGEYLGLGRIGSALFAFDIIPFGMSRHRKNRPFV